MVLCDWRNITPTGCVIQVLQVLTQTEHSKARIKHKHLSRQMSTEGRGPAQLRVVTGPATTASLAMQILAAHATKVRAYASRWPCCHTLTVVLLSVW